MNNPHSPSGEGSSSRSRSSDDEKGKQLAIEPSMPQAGPAASISASASEETVLLRSGWGSFERILTSLKTDKKLHPDATALPASALCKILTCLGMSPEIEEDALHDMLKLSGYADEDGTLDFERFMVFAKDFKLLESIRRYNAASMKGKLDRGPLGDFFAPLETGGVLGFSNRDFVLACSGLNLKLSDADSDSLKRYADLHKKVTVSFEQFLKVLDKEQGKKELGMNDESLFRRTLNLDKGQPLGRIMTFISSYTRSAMRKNRR